MMRLCIALAVLSLFPSAALAAFSFTEIMYDAPGTDAKHEWVEVLNSGAATDMSAYTFFENGTNHGLTLYAGSGVVSAGGYAVIADDAATFLLDFPSFSGTLFDSVFSLSNAGESVSLKSGDGTVVAEVTYSGTDGAAGDGATLNLLSGVWAARTPSPGADAAFDQPSATTTSENTAPTSTPVVESVAFGSPPPPTLSVDAGKDRVVLVGAVSRFSAVGVGYKGESLHGARYVWNFGNGATKEGQSVMYAYYLPGTYTVTSDVSSGGLAGTDRVTVTAVPAELYVTRANSRFIELQNKTSYEIDISLWQLGVGTSTFVLPPSTYVGAGRAIQFPSDVTLLAPQHPKEVSVFYPNGTPAAPLAPEVAFVGSPPVRAESVRERAPVVQTVSREPRVLGATTEASQTELVAAAIEAPSRGFAWASFVLLTVVVVGGVVTLLVLGRQ